MCCQAPGLKPGEEREESNEPGGLLDRWRGHVGCCGSAAAWAVGWLVVAKVRALVG